MSHLTYCLSIIMHLTLNPIGCSMVITIGGLAFDPAPFEQHLLHATKC